MLHQGTACLETPRLILRPFSMDDLSAVHLNWETDEKVTEFLLWSNARDISETAAVLRSWVASYSDKAFYQWAIVPKDLNEPIGTISAVGMDERISMVHIGYCIGSRWWRMGYTSEAFARIISFFFEEVKVNRIESQHDPDNINSGKVMLKCGLTYEGTLRQADWSNKGIADACMYSLLAEEYFKTVDPKKEALSVRGLFHERQRSFI